MNLDDEIFRQFIAKALEVQAENDAKDLSEEEMRQVAASMGITPADLETAYNAYWQRGSGFARLRNWDDAIEELKQAAALKPSQPRVLYALADAHRQRWLQTRQPADQTQAVALANRCAELDPNHFEALKLISELKSSPRSGPRTPAVPRPAREGRVVWRVLGLVIGLLLLGGGLLVMYLVGSPEPANTLLISEPVDELAPVQVPSNQRITEGFALLGDRGPVYWLFTEASYTEGGSATWTKDFYLSLINPLTGDTTKTITLLKGGDYYKNPRERMDIAFLGGKMYEIDEKNAKFTARDLYSAEVVDDEARLVERYPALAPGLGKLDFFNGWFELVTTKGEKYWYAPTVNRLSPDTEKLAVNGDYNDKKGWLNIKSWVFTEGDVKKLFLIDNVASPFQMMYSPTQPTYQENEDMLMLRYNAGHTHYQNIRQIPNRTFIGPQMVYASSGLAVILHASEVGAKAQPLLTCLDSLGNLRWYNDAPDPIFFTTQDGAVRLASSNMGVYRRADKIVINAPHVNRGGQNHHYACELDLKTGQINWVYSPTERPSN
jgi:hypothetical protein